MRRSTAPPAAASRAERPAWPWSSARESRGQWQQSWGRAESWQGAKCGSHVGRHRSRGEAAGVDAGGLNARGGKQIGAATRGLLEDDVDASRLGHPQVDLDQVVEPRRLLVAALDVRHDELQSKLIEQALLPITRCPQPFGARAFEELEIVRVVDNAAGIRVLVVDADLPGERLAGRGGVSLQHALRRSISGKV